MYTLNIDGDKKQVNGSAITSTSTDVTVGAVSGLSSVPSGSQITAVVALGNSSTVHGSQTVPTKSNWSVFETAVVTLTSVAGGGGPTNDRCKFTKNGHGFTSDNIGTMIMVKGSTNGNVDGLQRIIAIVSANVFTTDKFYVASATAGGYHLVDGNYATMTVRNYIMRGGVTNDLAGTGVTVDIGFGSLGTKHSIHRMLHMRTARTATAIRAGYWHVYEGAWTTAPTSADDISAMGTDHAATPTRAVPGELVYRVSGNSDVGYTQDDYTAKTS